MVLLKDPNSNWAKISDCGDFPCTAPNNIILSFKNTGFTGTKQPDEINPDFEIIPDDPNIGGKVGSTLQTTTCQLKPSWQGYLCQDTSLALLTFESLDDDSLDRSIQPIYILNEETDFKNTLNSMMDHQWDGFYTSQKRVARFPGILTTGQDYTLEITSTPPKNMRFKLEGE